MRTPPLASHGRVRRLWVPTRNDTAAGTMFRPPAPCNSQNEWARESCTPPKSVRNSKRHRPKLVLRTISSQLSKGFGGCPATRSRCAEEFDGRKRFVPSGIGSRLRRIDPDPHVLDGRRRRAARADRFARRAIATSLDEPAFPRPCALGGRVSASFTERPLSVPSLLRGLRLVAFRETAASTPSRTSATPKAKLASKSQGAGSARRSVDV